MKIYRCEFEGVYPVGSCLVIAANSLEEAEAIARDTVKHTDDVKVFEVDVTVPRVIEYLSGDY